MTGQPTTSPTMILTLSPLTTDPRPVSRHYSVSKQETGSLALKSKIPLITSSGYLSGKVACSGARSCTYRVLWILGAGL